MDKNIKQKIIDLVSSEDFINRNNLNINSGLVSLEYAYACINKNEYNFILDYIYNLNLSNGNIIAKNIIIYKINKIILEYCHNYFTSLENSITILNNHPNWEQKSDIWLSQRKTMLTGTDAGKVVTINLGDKKEEKLFNIAKDKLDYKEILRIPNVSHFRISSKAMEHGNIYEDVSILLYETRYNVKVSEYGLIKSNKSNFIGASPDGVITNVDYSNYDSFKRYGRLLEVKNPYTRVINDEIKPDYIFQMLQQQYTCEIPICDFLETTIIDADCPVNNKKPYKNIREMMNDVLNTDEPDWEEKIKNHNIPFTNLNSEGNEKGVLLTFKRYKNANKDDYDRKTEIFPITEEYSVKKILQWKKETIVKMNSEGFTDYVFKVWKLEVLDVKEFVFNGKDYIGEKIPVLDSSWKLINQFKQKLIEIVRQKQQFLSITEIYNYMKELTYSRYLTIVNNADYGTNIIQLDSVNQNNNQNNNQNGIETNIDINKYL